MRVVFLGDNYIRHKKSVKKPNLTAISSGNRIDVKSGY
jgi:hypothetical protein